MMIKTSFLKRILPILAFLCAAIEVLGGSWKGPEIILRIPDEMVPKTGLGDFCGIDDEGNYIFETARFYMENGKLIAVYFPTPTVAADPKWVTGSWVTNPIILGKSHHILVRPYGTATRIIDYKGHLIRMIEPLSAYSIANPDGSFMLYGRSEDPVKISYALKGIRGRSYFRSFRSCLFDSEGNYLGISEKPPNFGKYVWVEQDLRHPPEALTKKESSTYIFPDVQYTLAVPGDTGDVVTRTRWGWITNDNKSLIAWKSGQMVERALFKEMDLYFYKIQKSIGQTDGEMFGARNQSSGDNSFWDDDGNCFQVFNTSKAVYICKLTWVDTDNLVMSPPAVMVPLDGFGLPIKEDNVPPALSIPIASISQPEQQSADSFVHASFLFPNQDVPLENGLFPVYSLWDYQLSQYQKANPGAILGTILKPTIAQFHEFREIEDFAPPVEVDLRNMASRRSAFVTVIGPKVWQYEIPYTGYGGHFYTYGKGSHRSEGYSVMIREIAGTDHTFDPALPEFLHLDYPGLPGITSVTLHISLIETGDDTKVFVAPRVMTRLWLTPRQWPTQEKTEILVHSRNWANNREDTQKLTETSPGSGRFVNSDGTVIYEITHVLDSKKQLAPKTMPDDVNYLYMYITDPGLELTRSPQMIFENGEDTGEYWSFAEPERELINYPSGTWPYKPWNQVNKEIENAKFTVEVKGIPDSVESSLEVSWDAPDGKRQSASVPLLPTKDGKLRTSIPLLAFSAKGCDIGGTWEWTENLPTPQIPGVVTFRENNVKWHVFDVLTTNSPQITRLE